MRTASRGVLSASIWLLLASSGATAQMTLVNDASTTPAQLVIVPFYYAESAYTTNITLTNHGGVAGIWAMHFKEAENGREVVSCCAAPQIYPGASSIILAAGSSITFHVSGNSTAGAVTASEGPGACMYPH